MDKEEWEFDLCHFVLSFGVWERFGMPTKKLEQMDLNFFSLLPYMNCLLRIIDVVLKLCFVQDLGILSKLASL